MAKNKASDKEPIDIFLPWSCTHRADHWAIEVHLPESGDKKAIAEIHDAAGINAEHLAGFIVRAVNAYEKHLDLIDEMILALELCLECEGLLTWSAEHDGQVILAKARQAQLR